MLATSFFIAHGVVVILKEGKVEARLGSAQTEYVQSMLSYSTPSLFLPFLCELDDPLCYRANGGIKSESKP
jgi:hypothetical protein